MLNSKDSKAALHPRSQANSIQSIEMELEYPVLSPYHTPSLDLPNISASLEVCFRNCNGKIGVKKIFTWLLNYFIFQQQYICTVG